MSDYDQIVNAVEKAIKLAKYNKNNDILRPEDEGELTRMDSELDKKISELQDEKTKINTFLEGISDSYHTSRVAGYERLQSM
jgi:hypothetical protein